MPPSSLSLPSSLPATCRRPISCVVFPLEPNTATQLSPRSCHLTLPSPSQDLFARPRVLSTSAIPPCPSSAADESGVRRQKDSTDNFKEQDRLVSLKQCGGISTPPMSPTNWWGGREHVEKHRPWRDPPKRKNTVPEVQTEGWLYTSERVGQAVASVLDIAADVAHEILFRSITLLEFAPIPGLAPAARVLLEIWDALQLVDTNRLQCLRLTNLCADILLSVREEVKEAGDQVNKELQAPIAKLTESYHTVQSFLVKQAHQPFHKRYLRRDKIQAEIRACHAGLSDALVMLGVSVQIRILRNVQEAESGRRADQRVLLEMLQEAEHGRHANQRVLMEMLSSAAAQGGDLNAVGLSLSRIESLPMDAGQSALTVRPVSPSGLSTPTFSVVFPFPSFSPAVSPLPGPRPLPALALSPSSSPSPSPLPSPLSTPPAHAFQPTQVLPALQAVLASQDAQDLAHDSEDLRVLIHAALHAGSDAEFVRLLQIGREEMPEAIKKLQPE
ncbi:hypothetical protein C0992_005773 [Termitomyces sp. T32_za158]|nr:hypothetical protein C0992_005773 [Termitomyces sp. T32_za158]